MHIKQRLKLAVGRVRQWAGPAFKIQRGGSYEEYVKTQRAGFEAKRAVVFARPENIAAIAAYATARGPVRSVLCHGTRNGVTRHEKLPP